MGDLEKWLTAQKLIKKYRLGRVIAAAIGMRPRDFNLKIAGKKYTFTSVQKIEILSQIELIAGEFGALIPERLEDI